MFRTVITAAKTTLVVAAALAVPVLAVQSSTDSAASGQSSGDSMVWGSAESGEDSGDSMVWGAAPTGRNSDDSMVWG